MNEVFSVVELRKGFKGLKSNVSFEVGSKVFDLAQAKIMPLPDYTTIDLGDNHVFDPLTRYINHCCEPTARVDKNNKCLVAIKNISVGDLITFNYLESEVNIEAPFDCECQKTNCLGRIETELAAV